MFEVLVQDCLLALPFLGWAVVGLLVLCAQILFRNRAVSAGTCVTGLVVLIGYSLWSFDPAVEESLFFGSVILDKISQLFNLVGLLIALSIVFMAIPGAFQTSKLMKNSYELFPEFLMVLLFSGFGMAVVVSALDLSAFFIGIETLSIGIYCLCGFYRTDGRSTESALKYLFIGAFSAILMLYGIAFFYGATGSTNYQEIYTALAMAPDPLVLLAVVFIVIGLSFKLTLIPFHIYVPDVYEGAPTPVTAYMATMVKLAVAAGALRIFWGVLPDLWSLWEPFLISFALLSIIVGNLAALRQRSLKRLFAFSSISHAGFVALALLVVEPGQDGGFFPLMAYLFVYSSMTLGVFAVVTWLEDREQVFEVEDLKALGLKRPWLGIVFAVFALGLAGIPPLAGFMIKFWIIHALLQNGYLVIALAAIGGAVIGAAYYLRIIMLMFMVEETESGRANRWEGPADKLYSLRLVLLFALLVSLFGGIRPQFYADWILAAIALK